MMKKIARIYPFIEPYIRVEYHPIEKVGMVSLCPVCRDVLGDEHCSIHGMKGVLLEIKQTDFNIVKTPYTPPTTFVFGAEKTTSIRKVCPIHGDSHTVNTDVFCRFCANPLVGEEFKRTFYYSNDVFGTEGFLNEEDCVHNRWSYLRAYVKDINAIPVLKRGTPEVIEMRIGSLTIYPLLQQESVIVYEGVGQRRNSGSHFEGVDIKREDVIDCFHADYCKPARQG